MLHLVFQSPLDPAVLARISPDDDIVFLENALLSLLGKGRLHDTLTALLQRCRLYALSDDMAARGIAAGELVSGIEIIDDAGLVGLTVKHPQIQSWL